MPPDDRAFTARKVPRQRLLQQPEHPAEVLPLMHVDPHRVPHPIEIVNDAEPFPNDRGIQLVRPAKDAGVKIIVTIARKLDGDAFGHERAILRAWETGFDSFSSRDQTEYEE